MIPQVTLFVGSSREGGGNFPNVRMLSISKASCGVANVVLRSFPVTKTREASQAMLRAHLMHSKLAPEHLSSRVHATSSSQQVKISHAYKEPVPNVWRTGIFSANPKMSGNRRLLTPHLHSSSAATGLGQEY